MVAYAMVNTAKAFVADVVDWDGTTDYWVPPAGHTMILAEGVFVAAGFTWDGTNFVPPPIGTDGTLMAAALRAQAGK